MGEYQIITSLAKGFMDKGDSPYWASKNAVVEYRIALNEALNYEFEKSKMYKKEEAEDMARKRSKRGLIGCTKFKGNSKERLLVQEISSIMTECGYLFGKELKEYVDGCIAIERNISYWIGNAGEDVMLNKKKFSVIDGEKIYKFLNNEVYKLIKKGKVNIC